MGDRVAPDASTAQAQATAHRVLVVVPTLNESEHVATVLRQLGADTADPDLLYVVADGGSTDGTQSLVRDLMTRMPRLRLLHNPHRLQSAAVNLAVARYGAGARVLVRCDAHAGYPGGYVRRLVDALDRHGADSIVVPMDSVGRSCLGRAVAWVSDTVVGSGGSTHRGGRESGWVDHGHHAAFRMSSFVRTGGYDASFSHNEDAELDCRQRALGSRIFLDAEIRMQYYPRDTWRGLWRQYFNYGRGRARTVRKHPESLRLRQFAVPAHVGVSVLALALAPWWPLLLLWPLLYALALIATAISIATKRRSLCGVLAAPAAAVMHTAWALGFLGGWLTSGDRRWRATLKSGTAA
ncbi:MAG: glycosyltransferase family 2 protein [Burkholderiaceae bacterium]